MAQVITCIADLNIYYYILVEYFIGLMTLVSTFGGAHSGGENSRKITWLRLHVTKAAMDRPTNRSSVWVWVTTILPRAGISAFYKKNIKKEIFWLEGRSYVQRLNLRL